MNREDIYDVQKCDICGREFHGEDARLRAEKCRDGHERIFISIWDYELPNFISYFNLGKRELLPRGFLKKLRKLEGRALRSK